MFLLDTNVVSELRKITSGKADRTVVRWAENVKSFDVYLSAITIQELEIGIRLAERRDFRQGMVLRSWFKLQVLDGFNGRIIAIDTAVALLSAQFHVPDPHPVEDGLIAATALVHGMTVVTRNVGDYAGTGVAVLNPWDAC